MKPRHFAVLISLFSLSGCASLHQQSSIPDGVSSAPNDDVQYSEVISDINAAIGTQVRWGGRILKREKTGETSWRLTVIEQAIKANGRPERAKRDTQRKHNTGRFIVELDEVEQLHRLRRNNFITLSGIIKEATKLRFKQKEIDIPVVTANEAYVWRNVRDYDDFHNHYVYHGFHPRVGSLAWHYQFHNIPFPRYYFHYRKKHL